MLDIGTQGMQITNQAIIYALRPDARSRINSAYMVCYFIGGAVGSVTAGVVYSDPGLVGRVPPRGVLRAAHLRPDRVRTGAAPGVRGRRRGPTAATTPAVAEAS